MAPSREQRERLFRKWQADPVKFCRDVLGLRLWKRQAEVARAIAQHPRVAVRSGHKIGKSILLAGIAIWWLLTRPNATVIMTSATYRQVKGILWKELRKLYAAAVIPIGGTIALDPETGLQMADGREIIGLSTREPEKIAGYSGENLLFLTDEASGIEEGIFQAIEGNRAGGARILMTSNPTKTSGTFFDAFHGKRRFWFTIHVSSEDTPNATGEGERVPGLATREWVEEKRQEWGEESPLYQVRVRGNFPTQSEKSVVSLSVLEAARQRYDDSEDPEFEGERVDDSGVLEIGVDPARFGDDEFVIYGRRGAKGLGARIHQHLDGPNGAGKVLEAVREWRRPGEKPRVKVDVIGVGASVFDFLKDSKEIEVVAVNVASSPDAHAEGEPEYALLRDQLWFGLRTWLRTAALPEDAKLEGELVAPEYGFDAKGRVKVESKDSLKKRLGRSPDRADALALAIYNPVKTTATHTSIRGLMPRRT